MKVILLQDIYKHGVAGEVVEVAPGFARNYLIPKGMAKRATKGALKAHEALMKQSESRRMEYENMLNDLARQINGTELFFERRAASTGTLFGSVTTQEMADALNQETGIDINRRRISVQSIREIGTFDIEVRLGSEEAPIITVTVVREGELEEFLRLREEGEIEDPTQMGEDNELPEPIPTAREVMAEEEGVDPSDIETEIMPRSEVDKAIDRAMAETERELESDETMR